MRNVSFEATTTDGVWIGQADSEGPTVTILGGVHGDELTGIELVEQTVEAGIDLDTGTVVLILGNYANLRAGRASAPDANLNRHFKELQPQDELSYEAERAQELLPYLDMAQASLDLHDFTNECKPFIICQPNAFDTAKRIGAPIISFGWSTTEPGGTDGYMFGKGKEGLCYELGIKTEPQANLERGYGAVSRFLMTQGLLDVSLPPLDGMAHIVQTREAVLREGDLQFADDFANFQKLEEGEKIADHNGIAVHANAGDVMIFPMKDAEIGEEAYTIGYTVGHTLLP